MSNFDSFKALMSKLNSPQNDLRYIHVAGTNGKGSTCAFMYSILREAGYERVGVYTSPHLVKENERIRVNGEDISDADLTRLERLTLDTWSANFTGELAYFAKYTAIAFLYFKERNCDFVVLEVGMGGRLDATNIIEAPECAIITKIGLDHTEMLGDTLELIAAEKSMIIKPGAPLVFAAQYASVEKIFIDRAETLGVTWHRAEKLSPDIELGLKGEYQRENAANAKLAAEALNIASDIIERGLKNAVWQGRYERFEFSKGTVILDGGHNISCVEALVGSLKYDFPEKKITFIFNARADKDQAGMLGLVEPIADRIVRVKDTIRKTLNEVIESSESGAVICVFGTLYQVADVRNYFLEVQR